MRSFFPILIQLESDKSEHVISKPEDCPTGVPFKILETRIGQFSHHYKGHFIEGTEDSERCARSLLESASSSFEKIMALLHRGGSSPGTKQAVAKELGRMAANIRDEYSDR